MHTVLFLIDNSASMNQRCYLGTTLLDVAKGAVESFIKQRANRTDKYLLVTYDELPNGIKSGWKDCQNHGSILNRLKSITADGLTTVGQALKLSFDILSVNRHLSGIDTYGQGRSPFYLEPSMIVAITDGGKLSNRSSIFEELHLPMTNPLPGSELTKEPFRWDQRLFSLVLRLPANATQEPEQLGSVPSDTSPISLMCEVTGGRSYCVKTQKTLMQCIDSLIQKVQSGVVLHFEKDSANDKDVRKSNFSSVLGDGFGKQSPAYGAMNDYSKQSNETPLWHSLHRMIYVRPNAKSGLPVGHWPLPEAYCPDQNAPTLPPRTAHPTLRFKCDDVEPILLTNFPYDKYELEPSPLTQVLLEKKNSNYCWPVYVENSGKQSNVSHPCGYLKASTNLTCVNLFAMPYNYPVIIPLIDQLIKQKFKPSNEWRRMFDDYLKTVPPYYINPLRKSLKQIAAPNLILDTFNVGLSYSVTVYFKKLKEQTKVAADRFLVAGDMNNGSKGVSVQARYSSLSITQLPNFQKLLASLTGDDMVGTKVELNDFPGFCITKPDAKRRVLPRQFHNPFDIPRCRLLQQLRRMRLNFKQVVQSSFAKAVGSSVENSLRVRLQDREEIHNQPMSQMGNYQDYVKALPAPLREANPDVPKRLHTFGNPFKLAKEKGIMIDETEDYDGPSASPGSGKRKSSGDHGSSPSKRKKMSKGFFKYNMKKPDRFQRSPSPAPSSTVETKDSQPNTLLDAQKIVKATLPAKTDGICSSKDENKQDITNFADNTITPTTISSTSSAGSVTKNALVKASIADKPVSIALENQNEQIKVNIIKLIRKPGRYNNEVLSYLNQLSGTPAMKQKVMETLIAEALRFKRNQLLSLFQQYGDTLNRTSNLLASLEKCRSTNV
ncbi:integrator complex subunit 6-like [Clavelina lepadiformis]|uniref:VWFA domain-containing protein n=1 Tax=Clavelina lepadiformis TaxID=159417 RepID=A0ABP0FWM4_CLALP